MATTFEQSMNVVRTRWHDNVAVAHDVATQYDNADFAIPDQEPWARLSMVSVSSDLHEIGALKRTRHSYMMYAQLFIPLKQGDRELLRLADVIAPLFQNLLADGITWRTPRFIPLGRDSKWATGTLECLFEFDNLV